MGVNKKRIIFASSFIAVLLLVVSAVAFSYFQSKWYWEMAQGASNEEHELEYLLKSNFYGADNAKKLKIASLYIKNREYERAKEYINSLKGEEGRFYRSGYQLETTGTFMGLKNPILNSDLGDYQKLLAGEKVQASGQSDYSSVIRYFQEGIVPTPKRTYSVIYSLILEVESLNLNKSEKRILLARALNDLNHPRLAIKLIDILFQAEGIFKEGVYQKVSSYLVMNDFHSATKLIDDSLQLYPNDKKLLQKGLDLAITGGDGVKRDLYQKRLRYLESL